MYLKNKLKYFIPLLGSSAVLIVLFYQIDVRRLIRTAEHLNIPILVLVIIFSILFVLLKAFKWYRLLGIAIPEASYRLAVRSFLLGMTVSLFTPGRLGELARAVCFPRNRTPVLILTLMDKLMDVTVLLMLCALSLGIYSTALSLAGVIGVLLLVVSIWAGPQWLKRWSLIYRSLTFMHAVSGRLMVINVFLTLCCYLIMAIQFHLLLASIHSVPLEVSSILLPPILLVSAMPIFINGLGGREGVAAVLLSHYAIPGEHAILAAFLLFVVSSLLPGIAGIAFGLKIFLQISKTSNQ